MLTAIEILAAGPQGTGIAPRDELLRSRAGDRPQKLARPETARCDYRIGAVLAFVRRTRKDGTSYRAPALVGGERCTERVLVERCADGATVRRCARHIGASY